MCKRDCNCNRICRWRALLSVSLFFFCRRPFFFSVRASVCVVPADLCRISSFSTRFPHGFGCTEDAKRCGACSRPRLVQAGTNSKPTDRPSDRSMDQQTDQPIIKTDRPINQPTNRSTTQLNFRPEKRPTSQPINQSPDEFTISTFLNLPG